MIRPSAVWPVMPIVQVSDSLASHCAASVLLAKLIVFSVLRSGQEIVICQFSSAIRRTPKTTGVLRLSISGGPSGSRCAVGGGEAGLPGATAGWRDIDSPPGQSPQRGKAPKSRPYHRTAPLDRCQY